MTERRGGDENEEKDKDDEGDTRDVDGARSHAGNGRGWRCLFLVASQSVPAGAPKVSATTRKASARLQLPAEIVS